MSDTDSLELKSLNTFNQFKSRQPQIVQLHCDTQSSDSSQEINDKKKERQKRYREQNREKLKQREVERRKRKQNLQIIAKTSTSSYINGIELNKNEISEADFQSLSGLELMQTLSVQENKQARVKNARQKKRERQQRYREQNRDKLKQREAERRQHKQNSEIIAQSSIPPNKDSIEKCCKAIIEDEINTNSPSVTGLEETQILFVDINERNARGQASENESQISNNYNKFGFPKFAHKYCKGNLNNQFGHVCSNCDRLCFEKDLEKPPAHANIINTASISIQTEKDEYKAIKNEHYDNYCNESSSIESSHQRLKIACKLEDEKPLKIESYLPPIAAIKDEPRQSSEDITIDRKTSIDDFQGQVPLITLPNIKREGNTQQEKNDEPRQSAEDITIDCKTSVDDFQAQVPLITLPSIKREGNTQQEKNDDPRIFPEDINVRCTYDVPLVPMPYIKTEDNTHPNESAENNEEPTSNPEKLISSSQKDKFVNSPHERVFKQVIASKGSRKRENDSKLNHQSTKNIILNAPGNTTCSSDEPYSCDICSFKCSKKKNLAKHLISHSDVKPFSCNICQYRSKLKTTIERHLRTHSDEKPYSCNICSYKCIRQDTLCKHLRTHTGEKLFSCNICSYKSNTKATLSRHLSTHTSDKPFSCDICSYKCSIKSSLNIHIRKHTGEKLHSCNICSFKCNLKGGLVKHLRIHKGEKPYFCNICSYKSNQKANLSRHLSTHTSDKPFSCNICSYKCSLKSSLNVHSRIHTAEKVHSCNICSFKCKLRGGLVQHLRIHKGEKPYSCNICSYKCNQKGNLSRHLKIHTRATTKNASKKIQNDKS